MGDAKFDPTAKDRPKGPMYPPGSQMAEMADLEARLAAAEERAREAESCIDALKADLGLSGEKCDPIRDYIRRRSVDFLNLKARAESAEARAAAVAEERDAARGALEKYGWHLPGCSALWFPEDGECDCGFGEAAARRGKR